MKYLKFLILVCTCAGSMGCFPRASADKLWITYRNQLYQYERNIETGSWFQISVRDIEQRQDPPKEHDTPQFHNARDVIDLGGNGVAIFNDTFEPDLSILDLSTGSWTHSQFPGWSIVNNKAYGGITALGNYVYVGDMFTYGSPEEGIVRFHVEDLVEGGEPPSRIVTEGEYIDLGVGWDLYDPEGQLQRKILGLRYGGVDLDLISVEGNSKRTITLEEDVLAVAMTADARLFGVTWDDEICEFSAFDGRVLERENPEPGEDPRKCLFTNFHLVDIDIRQNTIAVGTYSNRVLVTDLSLSSLYTIRFGTGNYGGPLFVGFAK